YNRRLLDEAIGHCPTERVIVDHVLERQRTLVRFQEGGRRQFKSQDRLKLVDRTHTRARAVAVRLIHQEHEVGQAGEVVKVAFADVLRESLDARRLPTSNFGVDLGNVKDIDLATDELIKERSSLRLIRVAGDDLRRVSRELGNPFEYVLGC